MKKRIMPWFASLAIGLFLIQMLVINRVAASAPSARAISQQEASALARLSEEIAVHAARRGNPWINLTDGRVLRTRYVGDGRAVWALEQSQARGLSLASEDFDEDGTADLVCGYATEDGSGIIALHRGNVDSIHPNSLEAQQRRARGEFTEAPFLAPARVFELPIAAEFLGAGDFDAGGHRDVVAASSAGEALYLMRGDGQGVLAEPERIELPGRVTALAVGEINRADGLEDVVVGVNGLNGPQALVFEGPHGAMRSEPEVIILPAEATSLVIGQLDDSYEYDLAIAAGSELLVVEGRDRKPLWKELLGGEAEPATVSRKQFAFSIASLAIGEFVREDGYAPDIAVLAADGRVQYVRRGDTGDGRRGDAETRGRGDEWQVITEVKVDEHATQSVSAHRRVLTRVKVSSLATDDLVVIDRASNRMQIVSGGPGSKRALHEMTALDVEGEAAAVLPMRLNRDALSDLVMLTGSQVAPSVVVTPQATILVTTTNNDGTGSLRQAILDANSRAGADEILFFIGTGAQTIRPSPTLPTITETVTIDATTQPGFAGKPIIELDGSSAVDGFRIGSLVGSAVVKGLVINSFSQNGIDLSKGSGNNVIEGNFIGTDVNGRVSRANGVAGVFLNASSGNAIRNNLISGNTRAIGVLMSAQTSGNSTQNTVQNNKIGTGFTGNDKVPNSSGVEIKGSSNNILTGNLISGNKGIGVIIGAATQGNRVQGNLIGTNLNGSNALSNKATGVSIRGTANMIGGATETATNIISGNEGAGVFLVGGTGHQVIGNRIGTDRTGAFPLPNDLGGVFLSGVDGNLIAGNTIAFNFSAGILGTIRGVGNFFTVNSIHSNRELGIDLEGEGVTRNDDGDRDLGPNLRQNFPVLVAEKDASGNCTIRGVLESTPNTTFRVEFFGNRERDPSGHGEGETFIGLTMVTTDNTGRAEFLIPAPGGASAGPVITATATDPAGNTSEFSPQIMLCPTSTVINTANDGIGSFRFAIVSGGLVVFKIPETDPGFDRATGTWTFTPQTPLPSLTQPTFIYGSSQPGFVDKPVIEINGAAITTPNTPGLDIRAAGTVVEGLIFSDFRGDGIFIRDPARNVSITSNLIKDNGGNGIRSFSTSSNRFVGNTIFNNGGLGVAIDNQGTNQGARDNLVLDNFIGTDRTATTGLGNEVGGLLVLDSSGNWVVRNFFATRSGVTGLNVKLFLIGPGTQNNRIEGTFFGKDLTGEINLGGSQTVGIVIDRATNNFISDNCFANLLQAIKTFGTGALNFYRGNSISSTVILPIDRGDNGPDSNVVMLTSAAQTNSTRIQGAFRGRPNAAYTIEFFSNTACHPTGFGPGEFFIDSAIVTTDGGGNATIDVTLDATIPAGHFITATATDEVGGTTEFSRCVQVTGAARTDVALTKTGPAAISAGQTITYTIEAKNMSQAAAFGVMVTDDLPACLTDIFCQTTQGDCTVRGNKIFANLGSIDQQGAATVTITATVDLACGQGFTNTAGVTAASDTNAANDSSTATTEIRPGPKITGVKKKASKVIVTGENFQPGAKIKLVKADGQEVEAGKTSVNSATKLTGKKLQIQSGDRVVVENPDGSRSNEFLFTG